MHESLPVSTVAVRSWSAGALSMVSGGKSRRRQPLHYIRRPGPSTSAAMAYIDGQGLSR